MVYSSLTITQMVERESRDDVIKMIDNLTNLLDTDKARLEEVEKILEDGKIDDDEFGDLINEKINLVYTISDLEKDIAMYEEILHILVLREHDDNRACSPYEDKYDSWDEVFTGGDY